LKILGLLAVSVANVKRIDLRPKVQALRVVAVFVIVLKADVVFLNGVGNVTMRSVDVENS
jgi:hypothetical protein